MFRVVLVAPEIPPNTGNVGRLCLATNSELHLIEPLGFSLDNRQLRRAGLDYWEDVKVTCWSSLTALRNRAAADSRFFYFTTKAVNAYWSTAYREGDYFVFGSETRGLPESLLRENARHCRKIPMMNVRSLNLANSVSIVLYEAVRQMSI